MWTKVLQTTEDISNAVFAVTEKRTHSSAQLQLLMKLAS